VVVAAGEEMLGAHRPVPRMAIVVPTRNRDFLLRGCLQALSHVAHEPGALEIVVVDDGSTDDTAAVTAAVASSSPIPISLVRNPGRGVNAARNAGIHASAAPLIAFIDDDEVVPPGWATWVLAVADQRPEVDGIGGPVVEQPGTKLRTCNRCNLGDAGVVPDVDGRYDRLIGGNMVLRRSAFDRVGPFDASISGRGDEVEWFERRAGTLHLYYSDDIAIGHRRDHMSLLGLWRYSFRQGLSLPDYFERVGKHYVVHPGMTARFLAHAVRYRCANGLQLAARELGAAWALLRSEVLRRTRRSVATP